MLTDDFIDEAQVRFARATTKELARYIEAATIDAMIRRRTLRISSIGIPVETDPSVPPGTVVIEQNGRVLARITGLGE